MDSGQSTTRQGSGNDDPVEGLLRASNVEVARQASAPLLQTTVAARLSKSPALAEALEIWWSRVENPEQEERIEALALIWRLTSLSAMAAHRRRVIGKLEGGLPPGLPPINILKDPKDRRAVAEALFFVPPNTWLGEYAATGIVEDSDPKSDARDAMCAVILRQTEDIGAAFHLFAAAFRKLSFRQQDPNSSRARRVSWILRSLRFPLYEDESALAGDEFGALFDRFVTLAVGSREIGDRSALIDCTREVIRILNTVVRLHGLSVATQAETYRAIETLKRGFVSTEWPAEVADAVQNLALRVEEALLVLARQGLRDSALRRVYVLLVGKVLATGRLRKLTSKGTGLDSDVSYWLETGQDRERMESAAAIEETATALVDLELARALLEAHNADWAVKYGKSPDEALLRMAREMREAARKRGIALRGIPGEVVDFSPLEHNPLPSAVGERRVRVIAPMVERLAGGRTIAILVKADVVAVESDDGAS